MPTETRPHPTHLVCPHCTHAEADPHEYLRETDSVELTCRSCGGEVFLKRTRAGWETSAWVVTPRPERRAGEKV